MQNSVPQVNGRDHMEIARAARQLWQLAGRPPGRYVYYWTKVEQEVICARGVRALEAMVVGPVRKPYLSESAERSVEHNVQGTKGPGTDQ